MSDIPITQRDIEALRTTLDKLDRTVDNLPDKIAETYARKDVLEPRLKGIETVLGKHDDWLTWALRIVVGAVILSLLGLVIAGL